MPTTSHGADLGTTKLAWAVAHLQRLRQETQGFVENEVVIEELRVDTLAWIAKRVYEVIVEGGSGAPPSLLPTTRPEGRAPL